MEKDQWWLKTREKFEEEETLIGRKGRAKRNSKKLKKDSRKVSKTGFEKKKRIWKTMFGRERLTKVLEKIEWCRVKDKEELKEILEE